MRQIKLKESFLEGLIKKYIHVPKNEHTVYDPLKKDFIKINAWFAGKVAGFEKAIYSYDYKKSKFFEEPKVVYKILLCDGMSYVISEKSEFKELTEEEFIEMLAEYEMSKKEGKEKSEK